MESFEKFNELDGISLKEAWEDYTKYCEYARVPFPYSQKNFKEELKNYFEEFSDRKTLPDGTRVRSYYSKFISSKFEGQKEASVQVVDPKELPRVRAYDLRHRFASVVLQGWIDEGKNLYVMLPYLRAYMGHQSFSDTVYFMVRILPVRVSCI